VTAHELVEALPILLPVLLAVAFSIGYAADVWDWWHR
jgi:hypothetical protein